jgi:hypothetical protein
MARALVIEEESGTCSGFLHPHNGYFAGDFHRAEVAFVPAPALSQVPEHVDAGVTVLPMPAGAFQASEHSQPRAA